MELLRALEAESRARLPAETYDYFAGGAGEERSLAEHQAAWSTWWLRPRQLRGLAAADPATTLLGTRLAAPVLLAPAAAQRLLHPDGELAVARAAADAGLPFCLSTRATTDLADVAAAAPGGERWFQLYVERDREHSARVLARAAGHGYTQIVLTADLPVAGRRERERRHPDLRLPPGVAVASHLGREQAVSREAAGRRVGRAALGGRRLGPEASGGLGVVVKGLLTAEDAELAVEAGASAIVVSAHGARQLDGAIPPAVALPEVAAQVAGRVPVLVDGGVRCGADVARALALGADAVLIGRPYLWGLAARGQAGVAAVLTELIEDTARTLTLLGAPSPGAVEPAMVRANAPQSPRSHREKRA